MRLHALSTATECATTKRSATHPLRSVVARDLLCVLEPGDDRLLILALYDLYRSALRKEGLISVDQLVSDYLGYLDSFRWDARRTRLGFDAVFVDEFHLFNTVERAAFPSLTKSGESEWPVILMALDPRQSPRTVFLEAAFGEEIGSRSAIGLALRIFHDFQFTDVFRYTPEIAAFLTFVNRHFPETDLADGLAPRPRYIEIAAWRIAICV